jgi:peptidyl-prolyl cis-trans isomerase A (cyclophilin A)
MRSPNIAARLAFPLFAFALLPLAGCPREAPPEPTRPDPTPASIPAAGNNAAATPAATTTTPPPTPPPQAAVPVAAGDPTGGKWTMEDALKDLKGTGTLLAKIDTSKGVITCTLFEDKAPVTVASFVGLARGIRPFKDPKTHEWVTRPWFDGTGFHRIIKGFMIQGGDPLGNGTGEPGFVLKDELWEGSKHDHAGQLCMANRGHNTNGGQFFITDAAAAWLDNNYTIFGECTPVQTVHDIANVEIAGERPKTPVGIKTITIAREKPAK